MIDLPQIMDDLRKAVDDHGVDVLLLSSSEVQRNELGEEVRAKVSEVAQRVIKRHQRASIGDQGVELPDGGVELIALTDSLIRKGAKVKITGETFHIVGQRQHEVFGEVVCRIFTAERADGNGSG